jgi:glutathione S-transferase
VLLLYDHPLSPYAQKVKIALREKTVPFETRVPDLLGGGDPAFATANPRREVPALIDGDTAVFDSTIILEYVDERWPEPRLLPPDAAGRARARMIEEMCDTWYEAANWAVFEIRVFGRAIGPAADRLLGRAAADVTGANTWLERQLGGASWFGGTTFGRADLAAAPVVHAAAWTGTPPPAGSRLEAWLERVRARPSVAATFEEATAAAAGFEQLPALVASGVFKREYRDHRLEWMMRNGGTDIVLDGLRRGNIRFGVPLA